jgi:hypothetical protein
MKAYPYELERGSRKFDCPRCRKKTFVRVVAVATHLYLPAHVGRCDRESRCGYEYTWKQHFADENLTISAETAALSYERALSSRSLLGPTHTIDPVGDSPERFLGRRPDHVESNQLIRTLTNYRGNTFVRFLWRLFPDDHWDVESAVKEYLIGTEGRFTVFPTIDRLGRVCKAKLIRYDPVTGKRIRSQFSVSSLQAKLKRSGQLKENFETDKEVFFGEHLLTKYPERPVAIVESEKAAVIASICKGVFPDFVWLATGSKQWLKVKRITKLDRDRQIILYPDADGFETWREVALVARSLGFQIKLSSLIEEIATEAEKSKQVDIADYLINLQFEINAVNDEIANIKSDQNRLEAFEAVCEERKAILMFDGGMTEEVAEEYVSSPRFIQETVSAI